LTIRVGSRMSALAVRQAEIVMDRIKAFDSGIKTELVTMKTSGDLASETPGAYEGGKGLFVKELERALLDGRVDIAVHSYKDVPMRVDGRIPIVAVSAREDARDVLILPEGAAGIDPAGPIGCSGLRRQIQSEALFPGLEIRPVRGNILTRLEKLDRGEYSALILAYAGIRRLGLERRVSRVFDPDEITPAACQGVLAVQARAGFDVGALSFLHDPDAWDTSLAERAFVAALNGGCTAPVAAYAALDQTPEDDMMTLKCFVCDKNGIIHRRAIRGGRRAAARLGREIAATFDGWL